MSLPRCVCLRDNNRPLAIPTEKWVKQGEIYRIHGVFIHLKQNRAVGITLIEKPLDESCAPYKTFLIDRFGILADDWDLFLQLVKDCNDLNEMNEAEFKRLEEEMLKEHEYHGAGVPEEV